MKKHVTSPELSVELSRYGYGIDECQNSFPRFAWTLTPTGWELLHNIAGGYVYESTGKWNARDEFGENFFRAYLASELEVMLPDSIEMLHEITHKMRHVYFKQYKIPGRRGFSLHGQTLDGSSIMIASIHGHTEAEAAGSMIRHLFQKRLIGVDKLNRV